MFDTPPPCPTRRALLGGLLASGLLPARSEAAVASRLFAGTYASEGGAGLVPLIAGRDGWTTGPADGAIRNASFGVTGRRHGLRYLLNEQARGTLDVYDASFRQVVSMPTLGADPCHAALAPDGATLAVANYSSGSLALWSLDPATGLPRGAAQLVRHEGRGPNADRQAGPHAHWVGFSADGAILHAVDLGADAVFAHRPGRGERRVTTTAIAYRAAPGSGPRHLARHPRWPIAYLVAELANTVTVLRAAPDGTFVQRAVLSTLPPGFHGDSAAAHIALNRAGTRLYVSNRGHDSIAVYAVERDGGLRLLQHAGCGGHWPRFFRLVEERREMLVANERSGGVARLPLRRDGSLGAVAGVTSLPGVVFLGD
ncbi:MAG: 6-phosphogluconolactonase [Sphingomonas taxi]|uniref:6-phosphogluconolactonase n=1 Tax=Sphingomonas taxi TaxID=1549858 RepID=A0A2W5PAL4_9SPHN|nr:MAG: 6-phosphogluconolactonase [Sphingomonas taxi]